MTGHYGELESVAGCAAGKRDAAQRSVPFSQS